MTIGPGKERTAVAYHHRLLFYGRDYMLLETRCKLLYYTGYNADAFANEIMLASGLGRSSSHYGLAIFCYTLPSAARVAAHQIADQAGVAVWQLDSSITPSALIAGVVKHFTDHTATSQSL
jgi:hypothetical protein